MNLNRMGIYCSINRREVLLSLYLPWTACNFFSSFKQDFKAKSTSTGKESADYKCNDFQTCLLEVAKKYGVLL